MTLVHELFDTPSYVQTEFSIMFDELNLNFTHDDVLRSIKQLKQINLEDQLNSLMNFLYMVKLF